MKLKHVVVAASAVGIAALGVGSGCTASLNAPGISSDSGTIPIDSGKGAGFDSGGAIDSGQGDSGGNTCPATAPTAAQLDANGGWNPPAAASTTACTDADLNNLLANFNNTTITGYNQLEGTGATALTPSCKACVFTDDNAANWGVIVLDHTNEANGFINFGACYGSKVSAACGKAQQYAEFCFTTSCSSCADADFQTCEQLQSVAQACQTNFGATITTDCGDTADGGGGVSIDDICNNAIYGAAALCGGNAPDAG